MFMTLSFFLIFLMNNLENYVMTYTSRTIYSINIFLSIILRLQISFVEIRK